MHRHNCVPAFISKFRHQITTSERVVESGFTCGATASLPSRRSSGSVEWRRRHRIVYVTAVWCIALGGFAQQTSAQPACPVNAVDSATDVRAYACYCYEQLGITAEDFRDAVRGDTIDCRARCSNDATIACTTDERCRFCTNNNMRVCTDNSHCEAPGTCPAQGGTCGTSTCSNDPAKACANNGECGTQGTCRIKKPLYTTVNTRIQAKDCKGIPDCDEIPDFPMNAAGDIECDRPAWLGDGGKLCYGQTYIQKWDIEKPRPAPGMPPLPLGASPPTGKYKVTIAMLCRHKGEWSDGDKDFDDIAMIMHNSDNGQTCWFQAPHAAGVSKNDGSSVPLPHTAAGPLVEYAPGKTKGWYPPDRAADVNCISCHDNGPWMNSRWMFHSEIELRDGFQPYWNVGAAFQPPPPTPGMPPPNWTLPNFITIDAARLPDPTPPAALKDYRDKSCTSCHAIDSGQAGGAGQSYARWIKYTVGSTVQDGAFPPHSTHKCEGGARAGMPCGEKLCPDGACSPAGACVGGIRDTLACDCPDGTCRPPVDDPVNDIDYWMSPTTGGYSVYTEARIPETWVPRYKKHVDLLLQCGEYGPGVVPECKEQRKPPKPPTPWPPNAIAAVVPGVYLEAATNGTWAYKSTAVPDPQDIGDCTPTIPGDPRPCWYIVEPETSLSVRWTADADHPNCFIATTFPDGVEVTNNAAITTGTGTNWLLSDGPQDIGVLTERGYYYFHIDCNDDARGRIHASLTFQVGFDPMPVIPAVSQWGLLILTLVLLTAGKIYFGRQRAALL